MDHVLPLPPLPSPTTCYSDLPVCWFTLPDSLSQHAPEELFLEYRSWIVLPPLVSSTIWSSKQKTARGKMRSLWNPEWGGQEIIQQQLQQQDRHQQRWQQWAWERRRERECVWVCVWCVCVSLSESEFLCTVPSEAESCRRVASCVFPFGSRALWWGRAYRRERCGFTRSSSISERPAPSRGITEAAW